MEFFTLMFGLTLGLSAGWIFGKSFGGTMVHPVLFDEQKYDRIISDMERHGKRMEAIADKTVSRLDNGVPIR